MDSPIFSAAFLSILLLTFSLFSEVETTTFKLVNKCRRTIWPGILTGADRPVLNPTGFTLKSGSSRTFRVPRAWSSGSSRTVHGLRDASVNAIMVLASVDPDVVMIWLLLADVHYSRAKTRPSPPPASLKGLLVCAVCRSELWF